MKLNKESMKELSNLKMYLYISDDKVAIFNPSNVQGGDNNFVTASPSNHQTLLIKSDKMLIEDGKIKFTYAIDKVHILDARDDVMRYEIDEERSILLYWDDFEDVANEGVVPESIATTGEVELTHSIIGRKKFYFMILGDVLTMKLEQKAKEQTFEKELEQLINKHSLENLSNTPDFILARYVSRCLEAFDDATRLRDGWKGKGIETSVGNALKVEDVHKYFLEFASEKTQKVLSTKVENTVVELDEGDGLKAYLVQWLGMTVEKGCVEQEMPLREASKEFMKVVDFLVEKELIFHGHLAPFMSMDLAKITPSDRTMLLFYVVSRVGRDELNAAIRKEFGFTFTVANLEGELPQWNYTTPGAIMPKVQG